MYKKHQNYYIRINIIYKTTEIPNIFLSQKLDVLEKNTCFKSVFKIFVFFFLYIFFIRILKIYFFSSKEQLLRLFRELRAPEVTMDQKIDKLTIIKTNLGKLIKDPQQSFPDVFVWMIADKKRIAYARVKAESVLYSEDKFICAPYAGKLHSLFLQFYKYEKQQRNQRYIQAKIEIRLWLGCSSKKPVNYLVNAPKGYQLPEVLSTPYPRNLEYKSCEKFVLHAHIYQGRTVFGSDEDGLSDPFARIMFANSMEETWIVPNTRTPFWDQSFVFNNVILYRTDSKVYSPVVFIAVFDKDPNDEEEFLGQTIAVPKVVSSNYVPAKLELKPIFIGKKSVGDIIAAFELFPVSFLFSPTALLKATP